MDVFSDIAVFVRVVELRSFTRAGERLGLTPSGVSRVVSRLEERLGVRLLNRTTRSISLTDDGATYYERCAKILGELEDANMMLSRTQSVPRGRIRVDAPVVLGEFVLGPALPAFLEQYPEVSVDLSLRDHVIDPTAEGVDVVLRLAELKDSQLVSKKLGTARILTAGAPSYLKRYGRPKVLADLQKHRCLAYLSSGLPRSWRFRGSTGEINLAVNGSLNTNSGAALREAAVAGAGLIQVFEHHIAEEVRTGRLEVVLDDEAPEPRPIYALYSRARSTLPKVKRFLEFAAAIFKQPPLPRSRR